MSDKPKARLVSVSTVYHQLLPGQPTGQQRQWSRPLASDQQPYGPRTLTVGEEWMPLDCGWVTDVGYVVIQNEEGKFTQTIPTEEEREAAAGKVLEVAFPGWNANDPIHHRWLVPPGETFSGTPSLASCLRIRSRSGPCRYTLTVYPA